VPIAKGVRLAVKIIGVLAGTVVVLFLGALAINLFDEQLTPAARDLLTPPPNPYPAESNIYVAMAGVRAPSGQSMIEAGESRIEAYERALGTIMVDPDAAAAFIKKSESNKLDVEGDLLSWSPLPSSIWSNARAHRDEIVALHNENQELYERYLALHELHGYYEIAEPSVMAPFVFVPQRLRTLFLAYVATRIQTGTRQQERAALDDLQADLVLWRTVLKGNGTLLSKMLATSALHGDLLLIGDLVTDPQTDLSAVAGDQARLVTLFNITDWQIGDVFAAEMRFQDSIFRGISQTSFPVAGSAARPLNGWQRFWNALQGQFFRLRASENMAAEHAEHLRALADANPAEFSTARAAYRGWLQHRTNLASARTLYNPVGKILFSVGSGAYEDYVMRVYDVAAFQRLVCLAYQIRRQNLGAKDIPLFMIQHPEWATHPIDAKSFNWDPATSTVAVITAGRQSLGRRFSLTLPSP